MQYNSYTGKLSYSGSGNIKTDTGEDLVLVGVWVGFASDDNPAKGTTLELAKRWNAFDELVEVLGECVKVIENEYEAKYKEANFFNNYMPRVGQSLDYKSLPDYPKYLQKAKQLLNQLKEQKL